MRIGVVIPTYDQFAHADVFRRIVSMLEDLGYDSAWFGDHIVFPEETPDYMDPCWFEALTCAVNGLGLTTRLTFGSDVLVAPYRNPLALAKMASTASILSSGRLVLGMGIGWLEGEFEALGVPPFAVRGKVTEEYLKVMRALFEADGPVSFHGDWINFDRVIFEPRSKPPTPLLVGGNHANAIKRAALLGDGWHPLFMKDTDYASGRAEIERIRQQNGITRPFVFSYSCSQTRLESGSSTAAPAPFKKPNEGSSYAPPYPCDESGRPRFKGTAAQLREDCKLFSAAGVEQLIIRFAVTRDKDVDLARYVNQLERFAADVLPFCHSLG